MKTFYINQKIKLLANQYKIYDANAQGEQGQLIAFAHQKRFAFREKFTLYTDESKSSILLEVQARQVLDFGARYDVTDEAGKVIGTVGKAFGASLLKSTWNVYKPGEEEAPHLIVRERNATLAIVRRVWEVLPVISEVPFFVKYHFDFIDSASGETAATFDKTTTLTDHYRLDVEDKSAEELDWRVFIAQGVLLDALQSR